jgi:hypothetical protein
MPSLLLLPLCAAVLASSARAFVLPPVGDARQSAQRILGEEATGSLQSHPRSWTRRSQVALKASSDAQLLEVPEDLVEATFIVNDLETGNSIECYAERFAEVNGAKYLLGCPVDDAVAIAFEVEGEIVPVPLDDPLMSQVFPAFKKELEKMSPDLTLKRTAVTLTLSGYVPEEITESPELDEDEVEALEAEQDEDEGEDEDEEYDDEDDDDDDDDEFDDEDNVEVLTVVDVDDEEYMLIRYLEPFLLVSRQSGAADSKSFDLLDEEEDEAVYEAIEEMLYGNEEDEIEEDESE